MKLLTLLIMTFLLQACATQGPSQEMPEFETASQEQCARQCEFVHAGMVRGCSYGDSGEDSTGSTFNQCVDAAYTTLRSCYRGCR